jgi:hypothetical protein
MPFDNPNPKVDFETIYRQRRESAIALWATIPNWGFNIGVWRASVPAANECGTICCALGWLAEKRHDGWGMSRTGLPRWADSDGLILFDYNAAHSYFGITYAESCGLFSANNSRWGDNVHRVTLRDISEALRALPIRRRSV